MAWFSRSRPVDPNWHESWDAATHRVLLHVPFAPASPATSDTAEELSQAIVHAVRAVQAGDVGSSIPDGVTEATVAILVEPERRGLGDLERHTVDILRESLGSSIPLEVAETSVPDVEEDDPDSDPEVGAAELAWDEAAKSLVIKVALPETSIEARVARLMKTAFNSGLAAIASAPAQGLVPDDVRGSETYDLHLILQPGTPQGGRVNAVESTLRGALRKTKVTLCVEFASA
ncbi:hypothetical protein GCM10010401_00210 [Rarobacter faecitabidus]|uniref:Uncharacterized protein n=1 Tax=Rarobacter faecitabidus TaxID=13243 RepID=A0A542ZWW5_RARFA|nr:hypothetical protein [Rarobacter faecitabidus]TQL64838.1 hypothetical protein FB461_1361 [Rarobacter faecitabidus]